MEIQIKGYKCERCRGEWTPRKEGLPVVCPKCKSPYWNKPREKNDNSKRNTKV